MTRYFIYCFKKSKEIYKCMYVYLHTRARMHAHVDVAMTVSCICTGHLLSGKTWHSQGFFFCIWKCQEILMKFC